MTEGSYTTIKALVFDFVHSCGGKVDYEALTSEVKKHFPASKWQDSHWSWYRNQIVRGRFRRFFSEIELAALSRRVTASPPAGPLAQSDQAQAVTVTDAMLEAVQQAILAAGAYDKATDGRRKLGMTGEIGEVLCCHTLGLKLCVDCRSQGFDAVDTEGKRVQIKTRRSESSGLPSDVGRLGTFSKHEFDYAMLVLLDSDYRIAEIWRAEYADIEGLISSQKRRNPNLASFKRKARRVWPAVRRSCGR